MMEDRLIAAGVIIVIMVLIGGWIAIRAVERRRNYKIRQAGRGKQVKAPCVEPAE
jgi:hypothetical protein